LINTGLSNNNNNLDYNGIDQMVFEVDVLKAGDLHSGLGEISGSEA